MPCTGGPAPAGRCGKMRKGGVSHVELRHPPTDKEAVEAVVVTTLLKLLLLLCACVVHNEFACYSAKGNGARAVN